MPSCAYLNCRNSYDKHRNLFTFHRFPPKSNEELRKKWLLKCGLNEGFDCSRARICSAHFKPEDFERDLKAELLGVPTKKRLKDTAEPSINLTLVKEEQTDNCIFQSLHEIRPNFVLEQLAEVAVNRALDNERFNNVTLESSFRESEPEHFNGVSVVESSYNQELVEVSTSTIQQPVISSIPHVPSSLPASQNWPGDCGFDVSFSPQEKNTKGVSWTYSKRLDKLYVGKDAPCPINFSTTCVMQEDVKIRVMALYSSPESASEIVMRCVNHSLEEKSKNIFEAEHLVRCESSTATYEVDCSTKRHSVVVPFENPPAGQHFSTYIFKFTCFGSCPFGPNRRPLMLVFSLERGNQVIGRRKVDVKICACPGRDRKTDERPQSTETDCVSTSKKRKETEYIPLSETFDFTKEVIIPLPKKAKTAPSQGQDGVYQINVDDYKCYEFLKQMKKLYEICKTVRNLPPDVKKVIAQYNQRKACSGPDV